MFSYQSGPTGARIDLSPPIVSKLVEDDDGYPGDDGGDEPFAGKNIFHYESAGFQGLLAGLPGMVGAKTGLAAPEGD